MDNNYIVRLEYKISTDLPVFKTQQEDYPSYEEILKIVRKHASFTETALSYFESNAVIVVEDCVANMPCNQEIFSIYFPEIESPQE